MYQQSGFLCLFDKDGNNIDSGVPVDYPIEKTSMGTHLFDCSNFYNIEVIANYLSNAYDY